MSRIYQSPLLFDPSKISIEVEENNRVRIQDSTRSWEHKFHYLAKIELQDNQLLIQPLLDSGRDAQPSHMHAGTAYAILKNVIQGMQQPFEKKLIFVGVGYRSQVEGDKIKLSLNKSHPEVYHLPKDVTAINESPTILSVKSFNKDLLGHVCAEIRDKRPPERYKGKGIRYENEVIILKSVKKKSKG